MAVYAVAQVSPQVDIRMNIAKLRTMQELAFQNALRLHFDSIFLYENSSFPSAFFLSLLALEEIGKTSLIQAFAGDFEMYGDNKFVSEKQFLRALCSHGIKQRAFARDMLFQFPKDFLRKLRGRRLDTLKQNSIYVGFHWKNGEQDLSSRLRTPISIKRNTVRRQITILNDYLLLLTYAAIKGIYTWDTPNKRNLFHEGLLKRLKSSWKYRGRLMSSRMKWLNNLIKGGVIKIA